MNFEMPSADQPKPAPEVSDEDFAAVLRHKAEELRCSVDEAANVIANETADKIKDSLSAGLLNVDMDAINNSLKMLGQVIESQKETHDEKLARVVREANI